MQVRAPGARLGFWNGRPRIPPASLLPVRSGKIASGPPPPLPGGPFRRSSSNAFLASDEPAKAYTQLIRHLFSIPQIGRGWRGRLKPRGIILTEGEQAARSGDHPAHLPHVGDTSLLRLVQGARHSANCGDRRLPGPILQAWRGGEVRRGDLGPNEKEYTTADMPYQLSRLLWWFTHLTTQDSLTLLGVILSSATLVIVLIQLRLMRLQTSLMESQTTLASEQATIAETQLRLMSRQDEIMAVERLRRASLEFSVAAGDPAQTVNLFVSNSGNKTAYTYYWHLMIPVSIMHENQVWRGGNTPFPCLDECQMEGQSVRHFTAYQSDPLFPTRRTLIASFALATGAPPGVYPIFWSIICEDGKNPETAETEMNRTTLTIGT
jgi:hypothetical protein